MHATLCYGGVSFAEVFLLLMLYKGELCATKRDQLRSVGNYPNIERLMVYLQTAYPIGIEKLED